MSQIVLAQRGGKTLEMMQELKRKYAAVETENEQLRQQLAAEQANSAEWESIAANEQYKWGLECGEHQELIEKFNQQQATIASMRSALESVVEVSELQGAALSSACGLGRIMRKVYDALSNTANTEYVDRVKKLEEALRLVLRRYHKLDSDTVATIKAVLGEGKADDN